MTTKREPLLSDIEVRGSCSDDLDMDPMHVRDHYEAARQKDAELIQRLVDLGFHDSECNTGMGAKCDCMYGVALSTAQAAGFKPTQP